MKIANLILVSVILSTVGCTTYPKTYTYSPTVTINGDNNSSTPLVLPNPFAKTPRAKTEYNINTTQRIYSYQEQPSPLTARIPEPPVSANYYPTYNHEETYVFVGPEYLQAH